ncbi:MAG: zinc ribbon domain-containing protein [Candidatus Korobacteraceae bacterium]
MTQQRSGFSQELRLIPTGWAIAAAIGFIAAEALFEKVIPRLAHHDLPPEPWWTLLGLLAAILMAATILLIGYIYADAKRRGMNAVLWTVLVILIPKPIGFIAYFLLRKPLVTPCPNCGSGIGTDFRYCSKCGYAVSPSCTNCGRVISRDYIVCPYCGKPVTGGAGISPSVVS